MNTGFQPIWVLLFPCVLGLTEKNQKNQPTQHGTGERALCSITNRISNEKLFSAASKLASFKFFLILAVFEFLQKDSLLSSICFPISKATSKLGYFCTAQFLHKAGSGTETGNPFNI